MVLFMPLSTLHPRSIRGLAPLAHLPLQASPVFGNILNESFMVLHQQLMEPILLSFALTHCFGRQLQQLGAGLEEPAGVAGGFGCFHLVARQHPNFHAGSVQGFNRLCRLLLQPTSRRKNSIPQASPQLIHKYPYFAGRKYQPERN